MLEGSSKQGNRKVRCTYLRSPLGSALLTELADSDVELAYFQLRQGSSRIDRSEVSGVLRHRGGLFKRQDRTARIVDSQKRIPQHVLIVPIGIRKLGPLLLHDASVLEA